MRRTHDLITDFQCPNWDTEGDPSLSGNSLLTAGLLGLVSYQASHPVEAVAVAGTAHDITDAIICPEHGAVAVLLRKAHLLGLRHRRRLRGIDREAFAGGSLVHQERCRSRRAG